MRSGEHARRSREVCCAGRGYTLVEVIVTIVILAIAASMVIPSFASTNVLRVQAGVRAIVSDLTTAQSDALAFQRGRALVFEPGAFPAGRRYRTLEIRGTTMDADLDALSETVFSGETFGDASIVSGEFAYSNAIIFDELGSPVDGPGSTTAAGNQWLDLSGSGQTYRITIEAYTGRVTVLDITNGVPSGGGEEEEEEESGGG